MKEIFELVTLHYPQLIPIMIGFSIIGYIIGQFITIVDIRIKIEKFRELKREREDSIYKAKRLKYQKAFDECSFTPGEHGLYGETYHILTNLRKLREAFNNFAKDKTFDSKVHFAVYYWTKTPLNNEYKFLFYERFKKWEDNFIIDKKVLKRIRNLKKLISNVEIKVRKTEEERSRFIGTPALTIEYIDSIEEKERKKIIRAIEILETSLREVKTYYALDDHGTIPTDC